MDKENSISIKENVTCLETHKLMCNYSLDHTVYEILKIYGQYGPNHNYT